jgi:hypothetical protein
LDGKVVYIVDKSCANLQVVEVSVVLFFGEPPATSPA